MVIQLFTCLAAARLGRLIPLLINLFLVLVEIVIYLYENVALKVPAYEWPVVEGSLIAVSLPGSFFVMLPNHSF